MRLLTVGNMYPPHHLGGYELVWRSAVGHLRRSGHVVRVLTTDYRSPSPDRSIDEDPDVHRALRWYWRDHDFPRLGPRAVVRLERHNAAVLDRHLDDLQPEAVAWWAMGGMSLSLVETVRRSGIPALGVVHDDWLLYAPKVDAWTRTFASRPRLAAMVERLIRVPTRGELAGAARWTFNSRTQAERSRPTLGESQDEEVIHPGIDLELFREAPERPWRWRLLYCGRIDPRKGIDLAVGALETLPKEASVTILGGGDDQHLAELRRLAARIGVSERVSIGWRPRAELPSAYAAADAVVFPVRWAEPWGIVPLEGMAVGTPVIASGRGGSGEYLHDAENCLLFEPDDGPLALAAAVKELAGDDGLRRRLREGGLATAGRFGEAAFNEALERSLAGLTLR